MNVMPASRSIRLIPRIDIKGKNLIKGIHLEGLRVIGDPQVHAQRYYEQGADELIFMDTVASLYGRNNLTHIIARAAERIFVPITVGGGLRSTDVMVSKRNVAAVPRVGKPLGGCTWGRCAASQREPSPV